MSMFQVPPSFLKASTVVNGKEGELVTVEVKLLAYPEPIVSHYFAFDSIYFYFF